jgi:hypothetical protein
MISKRKKKKEKKKNKRGYEKKNDKPHAIKMA